jgi:WD40 repeat protein
LFVVRAVREAGVLGGYVPLQLQLHQRRTLRGHSGKVYAMQWSTDSNRIVSVAQDGKLIVWNAFAATREMALPLRSQWINSCSFAPSGQLVACCGLQGTCYVYRVAVQLYSKKKKKDKKDLKSFFALFHFIDQLLLP